MTRAGLENSFDAWVVSTISRLVALAGFQLEHASINNDRGTKVIIKALASKPILRLETIENRVQSTKLSFEQPIDGAAILITGDWWQGGHRTIPQLAETKAVFAWHQIPSIWNWLTKHPSVSKDQLDQETGNAAKTSSILNRSVICFSNDLEFRRAYVDAVNATGWSAMGLSPNAKLPNCYPSCILLDDDSLPPETKNSFCRRVRHAYVGSLIVATQGFPRWQEAQCLVDAGADYVVGKLVDIPAMLDLAERFSSAALPRM